MSVMIIDASVPARAIDDAHCGMSNVPHTAVHALARNVIKRLASEAPDALPMGRTIDVAGFADALVAPDPTGASEIVRQARIGGASYETLCIGYVAAAASLLGQWWEEDRVSFSDTAIATGRMLHILRDLRQAFPHPPHHGTRCALFATVPGEQHIIGVTMSADLIRDKGWEIDLNIGNAAKEICAAAKAGAYPIVGLSASNAEGMAALAATVIELRLTVPHAHILVGGNIVAVDPDIAHRVGADASAATLDDALDALESMHEAQRAP